LLPVMLLHEGIFTIRRRYRERTANEREGDPSSLLALKLRYFTPREVANLHGFPAEFSFPCSVTPRQRYQVLGNSLNVHVVAALLRYLFGVGRTDEAK